MAKDDKDGQASTSLASSADGGAMLSEIQRQASLARASGEAQVAAEKGADHVVAPGLSVSTVRGIVGPGEGVTEKDFAFTSDPAHAKRDFAAHVAGGSIVRGS